MAVKANTGQLPNSVSMLGVFNMINLCVLLMVIEPNRDQVGGHHSIPRRGGRVEFFVAEKLFI